MISKSLKEIIKEFIKEFIKECWAFQLNKNTKLCVKAPRVYALDETQRAAFPWRVKCKDFSRTAFIL